MKLYDAETRLKLLRNMVKRNQLKIKPARNFISSN